MKYSVITPVFNSFNLMDDYFKSMENQTFKDFEIVLVDDSSTDASYKDLLEYKNSSGLDIVVLKTLTNGGPGNARNLGIKHARGEWVAFVDSDDYVDSTLLEQIDVIGKSTGADCIIYDYFMQKKKIKVACHSMLKGETGFVNKSESIVNVKNHAVGKFYLLKNIINNEISFPNLRKCEDIVFVNLIMDASQSIYYYKVPLYYYNQRKNSLSNISVLDERYLIEAFDIIRNKLAAKYPYEIKTKSIRDLLYGCVLMMNKAGKGSAEIVKYINGFENLYPIWWNNPGIVALGSFKRLYLKFIQYRFMLGLRILTHTHTFIISS